MFNFASSSSLLAGQHDLSKERAPPSRPTPVTFPSLIPPEPSLSELPPVWTSGVYRYFAGLKKPSDVGLEQLTALNVSFESDCDFETLVSSVAKDGRSYIPPETWLEAPEQEDLELPASKPPITLLSNSRKPPDRREFYQRVKELFFKNEDAFSTLTRKAQGGQAPLRLAHFRRFWEGLDNMAYYWDCSLDEYLPPKPASNSDSLESSTQSTQSKDGQVTIGEAHSQSPSEEKPHKKAKTTESSDTTTSPLNTLTPTAFPNLTPSKPLPARSAPSKPSWITSMEPPSQKPVDLSNGSYKGYRIGNGAEMPDQYRLECVRSFLEPIAWAFGVTFVPHRRPPVLSLENLRFPVRMNSAGWRPPADRMKARQGWLEGPIIGVQCRHETQFGLDGSLEAESLLDATRELGGLLFLAQERAREGKPDARPGEGKWWTTKPRWGGGPGGEVGEATGASDVPVAEKIDDKQEKVDKPTMRPRLGSKDRRRPSPVEIWETLRPGISLWDPKSVYEAVGKERGSEWDEVFMVSSINHHISVLRLRVHSLYLNYITYGVLPEGTPSDPRWSSPQLHRTKWYDLFDMDERIEAMRGLWGIMQYQMRAQEQGPEEGKEEKKDEDVTMKTE